MKFQNEKNELIAETISLKDQIKSYEEMMHSGQVKNGPFDMAEPITRNSLVLDPNVPGYEQIEQFCLRFEEEK